MRPGRVLLLILLAGLLLRVIYLGEIVRLPFFQDPVGDAAVHLERALTMQHEPAGHPEIGHAADMVGMQMRDEDAVDLGDRHRAFVHALQRGAADVEQEVTVAEPH